MRQNSSIFSRQISRQFFLIELFPCIVSLGEAAAVVAAAIPKDALSIVEAAVGFGSKVPTRTEQGCCARRVPGVLLHLVGVIVTKGRSAGGNSIK